jgi:hypothetical protein
MFELYNTAKKRLKPVVSPARAKIVNEMPAVWEAFRQYNIQEF